jgi:hypothetical protein
VITVRGPAAHRMRKAYARFLAGRSDSVFDSTSFSTI